MFLRILLLLFVAFNKLSSSEYCEKIDWLQPFNNSSNFHCTFNGWYPDDTDENCRRYFVCVRNSENFLQLYLTCPNGTYFNEYTISCTEDYICPYQLTTTTEKAMSSTDVSNSCLYESDSNYFECNQNGSFPNYNDLTCRSYFYCINIISPILTLKTRYFCSNDTYFNPETRVCEAEYKCPCDDYSASSSAENTDDTVLPTSAITEHSELTTETEITQSTNTEETKLTTKESTCTNGETTTKESTTEEDISTKVDDTTESVTTSTSTELTQTTTIDECSYNSDPNYFTCTVKGRFRNANDRTCQTYFLCNILSSGRVIKTKYSCPTNSYFNPTLQLCDVDYECTCSTSEVTSTTEEITTQDVTVTTAESINTGETKVTTDEGTSTHGEITTEGSTTSTELTQTTTIDECSYNSDPNYFTCTVNGRFRNANDRTCQTYFLCNILSSGRVIKTEYSCPTNSYFNPKLQLCDVDYECTCSTSEVTSTTEEITTQDVTVTTAESINTGETKVTTDEGTSTDGEITTEGSTTSTELTQTTTIDECSYDSDPNYFTCTVKGRFRNANDRTCQTYFLCNILSSGRVIKTKYSCPTNSYFNPTLQLCDVDYECTCSTSEVTSTTEEITTQDVTVTTAESINTGETKVTTDEGTSTDGEITTEGSTTSTELTQTTTIDECSYNSDPNYFTCTVNGRFRNANDRTCQTYFLCNILSSGRVIKTEYSCPTNSYFNPKLQLCDVEYECTCSTSEVTSTTEEITTQDVTVTTAESINTGETKVTTDEGTSTHGEITTEGSTTSTELTQTTTIDECSYNSDPNYFTCTVNGRFRNANDRTCQTYFLCNILSSGRVIKTEYSCPTNSYFNPTLQLCDVDYECTCSTSEVTSTTEEITTQDVTVTTAESINTGETKVSTDEGTSTDGEITTEGSTTSTELTQTTTIDECSYNSNPNYFTCTVNGRFRNANDRTCQTYFLCNILSSGRVIKTEYSCPTNSYFNPKLQLCDVEYECTCSTSEVTSTTEEITTQDVTVTTAESINTGETKVTTNEGTSTHGEITTEGSTTSTELTQTTTIDECSYDSDPNYFTCTVKGRFRNANDRTCQTYFLCNILSSGRVIKTKYSCPTNSYFNPTLQLCDVDYECTCSTSEVTSTTEEITTQDVTVTTAESINTGETKVTTDEGTSTDGEITTKECTTSTELTQTTTIDECSYNSDPNYFTCTVKGRFRNANDRTCQTYFLCNILSSGRVIRTKYSCPTNSNFNPKLQLCDANYECPCPILEVTSTTE